MKKASNPPERGQSLVEFASGLVVLLVLLAGVMDLGRAFFSYLSLRDAAQEGAVYASICPTYAAAMEARVRSSSSQPVDLTSAGVTVSCTYASTGDPCGTAGVMPSPGTGVKVAVTLTDFQLTMPFLGSFLGTQSLPLKAEVTDTILRKPPSPAPASCP